MSNFFGLFLLVSLCHGLVLRTHNGKRITGRDLGPSNKQHHVHQILGETLYQTSQSIVSTSVSFKGDTTPLINPVDYGADPTGVMDSTEAFEKALSVALSYGAPNVSLSDGIYDCGGATIYLGGGDYLLSKTLTIPQFYGNIRITDGTIRANKNFSGNDYMIVIGSATPACSTGQGSCNEYINIDHLFCDCKQICYGCLHIYNGMSINVGPQIFMLGYNYAGITTTGGHSLFLINAWFGEFLYSDPRKYNYTLSTATSININNYDNLLNHVIVYSSRIGLNITDSQSTLINVHTWNLNEKLGGLGIALYAPTRLISCYLDHNDLVLYAPIYQISVEDTLFLDGTLRLATRIGHNRVISTLSVFNAQYAGGNGTTDTIILDETGGTFTKVENVMISNTLIASNTYIEKSVSASKKLSQIMATEWYFNFTDVLLFPNINIEWIDYTFQFDTIHGGNTYKESIIHWVNNPNKGIVIIETNAATNATVYVSVDQSRKFQY